MATIYERLEGVGEGQPSSGDVINPLMCNVWGWFPAPPPPRARSTVQWHAMRFR